MRQRRGGETGVVNPFPRTDSDYPGVTTPCYNLGDVLQTGDASKKPPDLDSPVYRGGYQTKRLAGWAVRDEGELVRRVAIV